MTRIGNLRLYLLWIIIWLFVILQQACIEPKNNSESQSYYVGNEVCKSCHINQYEGFMKTGMGKSFSPADIFHSSAKWEGITPLYDASNDLYYLPFRVGNELYIKEFRTEGSDTTHNRNEKIDYIIGSGHHTNSHLISRNGYVFQAPLTYYTQQKRWDFAPGFENGNNSRFNRIIGDECLSCHNMYPGYLGGSQNKFDSVPHGISCERCHGPASSHVEEMKIPNNKNPNLHILNPGKLSRDLQIDLCQRCHLQGNAVLKTKHNWHNFLPETKLSSWLDVYISYKSDNDQIIMASHAKRLQESKCYLDKKSSLTCITCHNPHLSVRNTDHTYFDKACISCHKETDCPEKLKSKSNGPCFSCHMPESGTRDIPHVNVHDHKIGIYNHKKNNQTSSKKIIRLLCVNNPYPTLESRAEAWLNLMEQQSLNYISYSDSALHLIKQVNPSIQTELLIRYYYLSENYTMITKLVESGVANNYDSWTYYRIGEAYNQISSSKAGTFFRQAVLSAPLNTDIRQKYAAWLISHNRQSEALLELDSIEKLNPFLSKTFANRGYVYYQQGKKSQAENQYKKALNLDPDYEICLKNYILLLQGNSAAKKQQEKLIDRLNKIIAHKNRNK